tara:strand:+ start:102 stop:386 length:285 start_codon:yes stop_codon:yes gene_type:complete
VLIAAKHFSDRGDDSIKLNLAGLLGENQVIPASRQDYNISQDNSPSFPIKISSNVLNLRCLTQIKSVKNDKKQTWRERYEVKKVITSPKHKKEN